MSALLPCPFCGGGETRISENRHSPTMSGNGGLISVEITHWCPAVPGQPSRNTVTRTGRDHASAIAAWNRRAPSADHFPDVGKMVEPPGVKDCLTTELERLRAEVASLRAALGQQPAAEGAEPVGCPIPGMCAAVAAHATAYRTGAEAMREAAAAEIDCGCSGRDDALAATNKGERFVACGNDPCGAIEARAIRALPLPEAPPAWQPIETAPRNREILVWNAMTGPYRSQWTDGKWPMGFWGYLGQWFPHATHWQPLPAPPDA